MSGGVTTKRALPDHHIDFIALDGSISLRLDFDDAASLTDDDGKQALAWGVCEQPWRAGDLLMLRISASPADLTGVTFNADCAPSAEARRLSDLPLYQTAELAIHREPNLAPAFTADMARRLDLRFIPDGRGDLDKSFGPEDVFHYICAVFHSPTYRERYDQFLRADFPRAPLTDDVELFRTLVGLGGELTAVHLLKSDRLSAAQFGFPIPGDNEVEKAHPKYYAPGEKPPGESAPIERGRVYISKSNRRTGKQGQYFDGVTPEVWESRVGGYQPMDKWLKDRKGRMLTFDDIAHYQRIAAALQETMRLTAEIDEAVTTAGMFTAKKPPFRVQPNKSGFACTHANTDA